MLKVGAIATFTGAMLAGTFSASRLAVMLPNSSLGEPRIWLTLLCAVLTLTLRRKEPISLASVRLAAVLTGLCLFLGVHAALFGAADFRVPYIINLSHLIVLAWLAVMLFRSAADTDALAWCLMAAGVAILPAWFMKNPPFSAITLYRIEFLGFAGALYLAMTRTAWLYLTLPIFLFGTLASVSKAAVAFAVVAVCYATFLLAVMRQPIVKVVVALAVGIGLFFAISLPDFIPRFNKMAQPTTFTHELSNEITINDASQRIRLALHAYDVTKQSLMWGAGIGTYRDRTDEQRRERVRRLPLPSQRHDGDCLLHWTTRTRGLFCGAIRLYGLTTSASHCIAASRIDCRRGGLRFVDEPHIRRLL